MGSGALRRQSKQPSFTVQAGCDDGTEKVTVAESIPFFPPRRLSSGDTLDITEYISPGQSIVKDGAIWKLNLDADPEAEDQWMRRRMWLTDSGGLFYYSSQYGGPVGCSVTTTTARSSEQRYIQRFVFELQSADSDTAPTLLAMDTELERDVWVEAVQSVVSNLQIVGITDDLDPVEPMAGRLPTDRRRLSRKFSTATHVSSCSGIKMSSYSGALLESLSHRLALPPADRHAESAKTMASLGPSVFGDVERLRRLHEQRLPARLGERRDSQADFASRRNTVLILDWDDTIFPTTCIRTDCALDWRTELRCQVAPGPGLDELEVGLSALAQKVEEFIDLATTMAKVVIVTLAKRPWVESSATNFMPTVASLLQRTGIEVVYAREGLTPEMKKASKRDGFRSSDQEADFWMRAKATAMLKQLDLHYNQEDASWKNVISIGDSNFERLAVITVTEEYIAQAKQDAIKVKLTGLTSELISRDGHRKRLRTKVVKLLNEPALEEMIAQAAILVQWFPHIVQRDQGFEVAFEDSWDDERLNEMHQNMTGAEESIAWRALAGLSPE